MFNKSKIVIDTKNGKFNSYLNITCPVDFGHLENDWDKDDQIDIFVGSDEEEKDIKAIICSIDFKNKFSGVKLLYSCTYEETNEIFSLLSKEEGVLLVDNPKFVE
jgi:hypothetical protein